MMKILFVTLAAVLVVASAMPAHEKKHHNKTTTTTMVPPNITTTTTTTPTFSNTTTTTTATTTTTTAAPSNTTTPGPAPNTTTTTPGPAPNTTTTTTTPGPAPNTTTTTPGPASNTTTTIPATTNTTTTTTTSAPKTTTTTTDGPKRKPADFYVSTFVGVKDCELKDSPSYSMMPVHVGECQSSTMAPFEYTLVSKDGKTIDSFTMFEIMGNCTKKIAKPIKTPKEQTCLSVTDEKMKEPISLLFRAKDAPCVGAYSVEKSSKQLAVVTYFNGNHCDPAVADVVSIYTMPTADGKCNKAPGKASMYDMLTKNGTSYNVKANCDEACKSCQVDTVMALNECKSMNKLVEVKDLDSCGIPGKKPSGGGKPVGAIAGGLIGAIVLIAVIGLVVFKRRNNRVRYAQIN